MSAVETVRAFRRLRALVVGDAMLDSYLEGDATRLCSEGPVPVVRQTAEERVPGGAANAAANLRSLGAEVIFVGVVGDDDAGGLLRAELRRRDIEDWLVTDGSVATLHKLRILANDQYVVRYDSGNTGSISPTSRRLILAHLDAALPRCDVVLVSDYNYGVVWDGLVERIRSLRTAHPRPLVVDSKNLHRFTRAGATVITPNHLEARMVIDGRGEEAGNEPSEAAALGSRLLELVDAGWASITMAASGVMLVGRDGVATRIPAHPVARASDVGAGDSFAAGLALALGAGASPEEAARIGVEAAAIAVSRRRTTAVPLGELLQRVSLTQEPDQPGLEQLATMLAAERSEGKRIVFTNGVFDILHAGHVHFLRHARELGDVLVVAVNSDASTRRLKGRGRPINSERDRLSLVAALDAVDHAVLFDADEPSELIRRLRPDVHAKGGDYQDAELPEEAAVREVGGEIHILPLTGSVSTSAMIDRILAMALEAR